MAVVSNVVVYINGVRFDPSNVSATFEIGDTGRFALDVPPVPQWAQLPPRSHAAVFFYDAVTGSYRLLCEGEYVARSRSKTGTGQRSRALSFRCLHGFWDSLHYTSMVGGSSGTESNPATAVLGAVVNGQQLNFNAKATSNNVQSLRSILDAHKGGQRVFAVFQDLVTTIVNQTPVEAYYFWARRADAKMAVLEDNELSSVIDFKLWQDTIQNGLNSNGYASDVLFGQIIADYEGLAFYRHTPIPSPPLWSSGTLLYYPDELPDPKDIADAKTPELMFVPELYDTVPPACNVIFDDQIRHLTDSQDFTAIPTRVVAHLQMPSGDPSPIPMLYMANGQMDVTNITANSAAIPPSLAVTHSLLSDEELERGVVCPQIWPLGFERLQSKVQGAGATITPMVSLACRSAFSRTQGLARTADAQCVFLPMLIPGFTCVVEDGNSPFRAMLKSVTHSIPATGDPVTSIALTHVNELYVLEGTSRTAPLPIYMNARYLPANIAATYNNVLGANFYTTPRACAVDAGVLSGTGDDEPTTPPVDNYTVTQVDMDAVLATVIPVPAYAPSNTTAGKSTGTMTASQTSACVADQLRLSADPTAEFRKFQWRPGLSIRQWAALHGLTAPIDADETPPDELTSDVVPAIYGTPSSLYITTLTASSGSPANGQYGIFKAGPLLDDRRIITRGIQASIRGMITFDGRVSPSR